MDALACTTGAAAATHTNTPTTTSSEHPCVHVAIGQTRAKAPLLFLVKGAAITLPCTPHPPHPLQLLRPPQLPHRLLCEAPCTKGVALTAWLRGDRHLLALVLRALRWPNPRLDSAKLQRRSVLPARPRLRRERGLPHFVQVAFHRGLEVVVVVISIEVPESDIHAVTVPVLRVPHGLNLFPHTRRLHDSHREESHEGLWLLPATAVFSLLLPSQHPTPPSRAAVPSLRVETPNSK
mmetsp:Transcript_130142/g.417625  ORF Transcript_130142/g.417625 Transcript_130142/m.417625 type:complete len:236 (-) Transcript_130142:673-1380(-)